MPRKRCMPYLSARIMLAARSRGIVQTMYRPCVVWYEAGRARVPCARIALPPTTSDGRPIRRGFCVPDHAAARVHHLDAQELHTNWDQHHPPCPATPGPLSTLPPRTVGGNLDIRALTAGATRYLPIPVAGARFSVGDVHAAQGDGEVAGTAIETSALVQLTFDLRKGEHFPLPRYLAPARREADGPWFAAVGADPDLWAAARQSLRGVLDYLRTEHHLSDAEAVVLASVCVNLHINQVVHSRTATVSALLPLSIFTS